MNIYTDTLLGVAAIVGLIGLSSTPAFADSLHGVLESNRFSDETVEIKTIAFKHDTTPSTIRDYVDNARAADKSVFTKAIAVNHDSTPRILRDYVDNARAAIEANVAVESVANAGVNRLTTKS